MKARYYEALYRDEEHKLLRVRKPKTNDQIVAILRELEKLDQALSRVESKRL